jgi:hypothetical protein
MKSMLMKIGSLAVLLALSTMLLTQQSSSAPPNPVKSYSIAGSLCGTYEPLDPLDPQGEWAWLGSAVISLANQQPKFATFVDRNNWSATRTLGQLPASTGRKNPKSRSEFLPARRAPQFMRRKQPAMHSTGDS